MNPPTLKPVIYLPNPDQLTVEQYRALFPQARVVLAQIMTVHPTELVLKDGSK